MRTCAIVLGLVLLPVAAGCAEPPEPAAEKPIAETPAAEKPAEAVKEESVAEYESQTHGAVQVTSANKTPGDTFNVLPEGESEFDGAPTLLGGQRELAPGTYLIDVNRTQRKVKVEAGKMTILRTGDLLVESPRKGHFWIPKQGKETRLASNPPTLNASVALFPGTYTVFVNVDASEPLNLKDLGNAEVKAGTKTVVKE